MTRVDRIVAAGAVIGGAVLAASSWQLGLGNVREPGPGAWPFLLALVLAVLGGWLLLRPPAWSQAPRTGGGNWRGLLISLAAMLGYVMLLERLGYLLAMTALLFMELSWVEGKRWGTSLVVSVLAAAVSFIVFGVWLKVSLPSGLIPVRAGF